MSINSFENYPMSWKPDLSKTTGPKYLALAQLLEEEIRTGRLKGGTKLPPQRELADFLNVNLSTVSKALKLCEQKGFVSASVGCGTFVASGATAEPVLLGPGGNSRLIEMGAIVPDVLCNQRVKAYLEELLKRPDSLALFSYGVPEGSTRHREAGVAWLGRSGFQTDRDHVVLAAGGQNALTGALGTFFHQGDKVGTDPLTYPGVKTAAKMLGIHLIPVRSQNHEMTEEGIRYAMQNENIKGLYVIPDFQNPTSHVMSLETRKKIAQVAEETGLLVIEDGLNNLLEEDPLPPIASFAPEHVVYLSSLSKTVAPGLRTAFLHVPKRNYQDLVTSLYSMNIALSPLLATLSAGLIEEGIADEILAARKEQIAQRNRIVNSLLGDCVAAAQPTCPLRYLQLPERFTGKTFELRAQEIGVQIYGAERFVIGNQPAPRTVRLSVTTPRTTEELTVGLTRLKELLFANSYDMIAKR